MTNRLEVPASEVVEDIETQDKPEIIAGDWYGNYVVCVKVGELALVFGSGILVDGL